MKSVKGSKLFRLANNPTTLRKGRICWRDIIREMYETGELTEMFQTHGINANPT